MGMESSSGLATAPQRPSYIESGSMAVSLNALIFTEQVDGAALNTNLWMTSVLTQAIAQASGFITLNSALSTVVNTYAILTSIKAMQLYGHLPFTVVIRAKVNITPIANATIELGIGAAATNAAPTDGAFYRWQGSDQTFRCVINNNGVETVSAALTAPAINVEHIFEIDVVEDNVFFTLDDVVIATINVPATQAYPVNNGRQTVFARTYNGAGVPATAPQLGIGQVNIVQEDLNQNKLWKEILVSLGRGSYQQPITPYTQSANHANSTDPSSATLSNTAAGYTTLGGRWQFAAVAGAATDYALFGFQVPATYQLNLSSIAITAMLLGAAIATSATVLDWSLGINGSAVSLATAESPPATYAARRIPLGMQSFILTAPNGPMQIGDVAPDIVRTFDPPLVVDGGRFVHVILEIPLGTATASQVFRGDVQFNGYHE
jgi:hypothetical protein